MDNNNNLTNNKMHIIFLTSPYYASLFLKSVVDKKRVCYII